MNDLKISVLGAGSWGTTIANLLAENGLDTTLWVFEEPVYKDMVNKKQNVKYLPGVFIPDQLKLTLTLEESVKGMDIIVLGVPSHVVREVSRKIKPMLKDDVVIVNLAKGIENDTLLRMSQVINEETGLDFGNIVALYGPSHAEEVSRGVPTTVVSACSDIKMAEKMQQIFSSNTFRVYASNDVIGVELGGSLKNVIAVAAGICDGIGYGDNTKAALITRGLVEISRLGAKLGANTETFAGLSGIGDLIVTCMSRHSRNRHVGEKIAQGQTLETVIANMNMVAEGVKTTRSVHQLIKKLGVEMPIAEKVYKVLFEGKNASDEVKDLMVRELKREQFGG